MPKQIDSEHLDKKTKILIIVGVVIMDIILALIFFSDSEETKIDEPTEQKVVVDVPAQLPTNTETSAENKIEEGSYGAGQYKVGVDIPAGEYLAVGDGYLELTREPTGNIIFNNNFTNRHYVEGREGEYIRINAGLKLYPVDKAPKFEINPNEISAGQYKVGVDIPAGEYKIISYGNGYFAALTNSHDNSIISNVFMPQTDESHYINVKAGQYLLIKNARATLMK